MSRPSRADIAAGRVHTNNNIEWMVAHSAWNWQWPDERGRWQTGKQAKGPSPKAPKILGAGSSGIYIHGPQTYYGPSGKTLRKRAAKGQRTRSGRRRIERGK